MTTKLKFSAPEVNQALDRLARAIVKAHGSTPDLIFVGVADGGNDPHSRDDDSAHGDLYDKLGPAPSGGRGR